MNQVSIGNEVDTRLYLSGASAAAPFKGCKYHQRAGLGHEITETADLILENDVPATIGTGLSQLEYWLEKARDFQRTKTGYPVYVWIQDAPTDPVYRSMIVEGFPEPIEGGWKGYGSIGIRLTLVRANYWEGEEVQVHLTNKHGINTLVSVPVYNHSDAAHDNFVDLVDTIQGDLPSPARIVLINDGIPAATGTVYLALHSDIDPANPFPHMLEGEAGTAALGANAADADCSGGSKKTITWNTAAETLLLGYTLTSANLAASLGRYYRPLIRFYPAHAYTDVWFKLKFSFSGIVVWESPWFLSAEGVELQELPTIQLPPYLTRLTTIDSLSFSLYAKYTGAGPKTIHVDYLQLTPTDAFRKLFTLGHGWVFSASLCDDSISEHTYVITLGQKHTDYIGFGKFAFLRPARQHRLYLLQTSLNGTTAPIVWTANALVYYRPRKRLV